jgi:hypothetical protein
MLCFDLPVEVPFQHILYTPRTSFMAGPNVLDELIGLKGVRTDLRPPRHFRQIAVCGSLGLSSKYQRKRL